MSETQDGQRSFLRNDEDVARSREDPVLGAPPGTGLLVTNHLNLMYMLGAGLLMPPSGFGDKYYRDTLAPFPGWLPLFIGHGRRLARAPLRAIEASKADNGEPLRVELRPVLVEVELTGLSGSVHVHGDAGWTVRRLESGMARDECLLCVPAPLPTARIRSILFRTAGDRRATEEDAADRRNVPLTHFGRKVAKARFSGSEREWPPADGPAKRDVSLGSAQAAGGVMSVLHALANGGELAAGTCRAAFDPDAASPADELLETLPEWMTRGTARLPGVTSRALFWGALDRVVENRDSPDGRRSEDALVGFLRESVHGMDGELRERADALVRTLTGLGGGFGGGSPREMLGEHQKSLPRAMILFFLRQKSGDLVDLLESHPQLSDSDKLAAAVLFGARDGWLGLPCEMRGPAELGHAVTHRMAALAHRLDNSGFDLGEAPPRVRPLRELFGDPAQWDVKAEKAAVRLARGLKWNCIRTTVSLGRGRYQFRIEGGSAHIDFEGEPKVVTRVDRGRFLEALAGERIDSRVDQAVRRDLGG